MELSKKVFTQGKIEANILSGLFTFFFVLSFWNVTYQLNGYILYSILFIPFLIRNRMDKYLHWGLVIFIALFFVQLIYGGGKDAFRIYKTFAVLLPVFLCGQIKENKLAFDLFDAFIYLNVTLVYIDFILFFVIGTTLIPVGNSGIMPRIGALTEDSNFYSYLILVYSFFKIVRTNRLPFICLFSIVLSGSLAAILMSVILFLLYKKIDKIENGKKEIVFRNLVTTLVIGIFISYFILVYYSTNIIDYLESLGFIGLLEIKIISISHRFLVQNESLMLFGQQYNVFMGAGAGQAINLNSLSLNLHNSYCQLFLESGLLCFLLVISLIAYMGKQICNLKIYMLYCAVFLLGCMMEVLYFPLLSFIFYYDRANVSR